MTQKNPTTESRATTDPAPKDDPAQTPKKRWTNWAPGDFWLQLATVIIGIAVTFGGSSLIEKRAERKRNNFILVTMREELQGNLDRIRFLRERLAYEHEGAIVLRRYIDTPETIPDDSLEKYLNVIAGIRTFGPESNSLEMLKSSSQIQNIRNLPLIRDLFVVYGQMVTFNARLEMYNSPKVRFQDDRNSMPYEDLEATYQSHRRAFVEMLKFPAIRNFIVSAASNNLNLNTMMTYADSLAIKIPRVIDEIDKEVAR
jgi:hypothetical protein